MKSKRGAAKTIQDENGTAELGDVDAYKSNAVDAPTAGTVELSDEDTELMRRRAAIRKSMQGNKRKNTKPELLVRKRLRAAGYTGYRIDWAKAPGRPDIAFPGRKIAIFVNGCYWHRCPKCHPSMPKHNVEFWEAKFHRNVARDQRALKELEELGWTAITVWECDLKRDRIDATMDDVIERIRSVWD